MCRRTWVALSFSCLYWVAPDPDPSCVPVPACALVLAHVSVHARFVVAPDRARGSVPPSRICADVVVSVVVAHVQPHVHGVMAG